MSILPPLLRGRGYFSHLGTIRTKPGRSDSPPTHSKSCSDKLSTKTYLSLLLTPTSYLIVPQSPQTYISTLTLPESEYNSTGCSRAFGKEGRLSPMSSNPKSIGGYSFHPFDIQTTSLNFPFSRKLHIHDPPGTPEPTPSNISTISIVPHKTHETIISGVLQGRKAFSGNVLGASVVSKMRLWKGVVSVARELQASIGTIAPKMSKSGNEIGGDCGEVYPGGKENSAEENGMHIIQDLMAWIFSRKKYSELKEPESGESGSPIIEVGNREEEETEGGTNDMAISSYAPLHSAPGPTIRLNRTLAKQHVRSILASAGTSSWVRNGGDDFELSNSENITSSLKKRVGEKKTKSNEK